MNDAVKIMNRRVLKVIGVLVLCVVLVASCVRKPLYDECLCETRLAIPISVDWSVSGVTLQNVSVLFYDADNGELRNELRYQQNANEVQAYAYLPVGNYTAVVFNELRNQIDYVSCVGHENLQTLKFESRAAKPLLSRGPENKYIEQPGELAVAMVEGIEVTSEMILEAAFTKHYEATKAPQLSNPTRATVESLTGIVPKRKTTIVDITAHIKNIYYARMPALVDLVNVADGYCVMQDENSGVPATLQFTMNNRTYDAGSDRDGTISTQVTTFGTLADRDDVTGYDQLPLMVDVLLKLVDEEQTEVRRAVDVKTEVTHEELADGSIRITIDIWFDDPLPEVKPEWEGADSGFGAGVEDWDTVDVPLEQ